MKYYEVIGDSGASVRRGFCSNCGARLFGKAAASVEQSHSDQESETHPIEESDYMDNEELNWRL